MIPHSQTYECHCHCHCLCSCRLAHDGLLNFKSTASEKNSLYFRWPFFQLNLLMPVYLCVGFVYATQHCRSHNEEALCGTKYNSNENKSEIKIPVVEDILGGIFKHQLNFVCFGHGFWWHSPRHSISYQPEQRKISRRAVLVAIQAFCFTVFFPFSFVAHTASVVFYFYNSQTVPTSELPFISLFLFYFSLVVSAFRLCHSKQTL